MKHYRRQTSDEKKTERSQLMSSLFVNVLALKNVLMIEMKANPNVLDMVSIEDEVRLPSLMFSPGFVCVK